MTVLLMSLFLLAGSFFHFPAFFPLFFCSSFCLSQFWLGAPSCTCSPLSSITPSSHPSFTPPITFPLVTSCYKKKWIPKEERSQAVNESNKMGKLKQILVRTSVNSFLWCDSLIWCGLFALPLSIWLPFILSSRSTEAYQEVYFKKLLSIRGPTLSPQWHLLVFININRVNRAEQKLTESKLFYLQSTEEPLTAKMCIAGIVKRGKGKKATLTQLLKTFYSEVPCCCQAISRIGFTPRFNLG